MLKFHPLEVAAVQSDAEDAVSLALTVPDALRDAFRSRAGQHIVVRAHVGGQEIRRTYSLVNAAGELPLRIGVRIHPHGALSRYIATQVRAGDTLEVMPPNGSFGPRALEPGLYVAFAAGCGITPVLAITRTLLDECADAHVMLFYGNRGAARTMFLEELLALKNRYLERLALHFVMSREPQDVELFNGRIDRQKVKAFAGRLFDPLKVREYFVCGPGTMIDEVSGTLRELGADPARIHSEHFTAATAAEAGGHVEPVAHAAEGLTEVVVTMDGRRRTFTMRTGEETILDAAANAGLDLPYSCRAGVCSTCRTRLVSGEVEMAENYALEDWELERGFILACQSRAKTPRIELDYDER